MTKYLLTVKGSVAGEFEFESYTIVTKLQKAEFERAYNQTGGSNITLGNFEFDKEDINFNFKPLRKGDEEVLKRLSVAGSVDIFYNEASRFFQHTIENYDSDCFEELFGDTIYVKIVSKSLGDIHGSIYEAKRDEDGDFIVKELMHEYDIIFTDEAIVVTKEEFKAQKAKNTENIKNTADNMEEV